MYDLIEVEKMLYSENGELIGLPQCQLVASSFGKKLEASHLDLAL